jgi:hypothetical protein
MYYVLAEGDLDFLIYFVVPCCAGLRTSLRTVRDRSEIAGGTSEIPITISWCYNRDYIINIKDRKNNTHSAIKIQNTAVELSSRT